MAYTPINWQTGDVITAAKMNKMDNGWSVETTSSTLFSETVECDFAQGDPYGYGILVYSTQLTDSSLTITFDGTTYTCPIQAGEGFNAYGGAFDANNDTVDFTTYPFALISHSQYGNSLCDESGGTHTISVVGSLTTVETSSDFDMAVAKGVPDFLPLKIVLNETTFAEVEEALRSGRQVIYISDSNQNRTWQNPVIFTTRSTTPLRVVFLSCDNNGANVQIGGLDADSVNGVIYA